MTAVECGGYIIVWLTQEKSRMLNKWNDVENEHNNEANDDHHGAMNETGYHNSVSKDDGRRLRNEKDDIENIMDDIVITYKSRRWHCSWQIIMDDIEKVYKMI